MSGAFDGNGWTPETVQQPVERVERLVFWVAGIPVPQGSKKGFVVGRRAVIVDVNKDKLKAWRETVQVAAERMLTGRQGFTGPVEVSLAFLLPRPATVTRELPSVPPDLDKLIRAVNDALTYAGVYEDDARIVDSKQSKRYADDEPGVWITVEAVS